MELCPAVDTVEPVPADLAADEPEDVLDEGFGQLEDGFPEDPVDLGMLVLEPGGVLKRSAEGFERTVELAGLEALAQARLDLGERIERVVRVGLKLDRVIERLVNELLVDLAQQAVGAVLEIEQVGGDDVGQLGEELAVEAGLDLDLARQVKLLGVGLAPFVPFLENLAEPYGIDLDELLLVGGVVPESATNPSQLVGCLETSPAACPDHARALSSPPRALSIRPGGPRTLARC